MFIARAVGHSMRDTRRTYLRNVIEKPRMIDDFGAIQWMDCIVDFDVFLHTKLKLKSPPTFAQDTIVDVCCILEHIQCPIHKDIIIIWCSYRSAAIIAAAAAAAAAGIITEQCIIDRSCRDRGCISDIEGISIIRSEELIGQYQSSNGHGPICRVSKKGPEIA